MVFAGQREKSYEYGLPGYLQHDLDMYKEGLKTHSNLLDCYWGELYGNINSAEIDDGAISVSESDTERSGKWKSVVVLNYLKAMYAID